MNQDILRAADLGTEFTLIQDTQEIDHVLDGLGISNDGEFCSLFVEILDGDYGRVYGCRHLRVLESHQCYEVRTWYGINDK